MTAIIFIPLVIVLVVAFGYFIGFLSRKLSGRLSQRSFMIVALAIIGGIIGGIVLMFQPWTLSVFNLGFDLVLICTLAFTAWSHVTPRPRQVEIAGER